MSTLEVTRPSHGRSTRFRTRLLALGALTAIGATALIVALSVANQATRSQAAIRGAEARSHTPRAAVASQAPAGYFRDPTTHVLVRVSTTRPTVRPARSSQPTRHSVLPSLTPTERQYVLGIVAMSRSQQAAAFGTAR